MKILIVDKDSAQIETICRGLFLAGYTNISAQNCEEAREILRRDTEKTIALVITDIAGENGKSGVDLVENIQSERPEIKIIVTSSLMDIPGMEKIRRKGIPILRKPFSYENLDEFIQRIYFKPDQIQST